MLPRIPYRDEEAFRFSLNLPCLASPCRAGDSRSRPQAAKRGRGTRSLDGMPPDRPRWSQAGNACCSLTAPIHATVRMTSQPRRLAWQCRRCSARCGCRARAARWRPRRSAIVCRGAPPAGHRHGKCLRRGGSRETAIANTPNACGMAFVSNSAFQAMMSIGSDRSPMRYSWTLRDQIRSFDLSNWNAPAICRASR